MDKVLIPISGWVLEKISKINESPAVNVGDKYSGYFYDLPRVGESFHFYRTNTKIPTSFPFSTSIVVEIVDNITFRTKNSIYRLTTIQQEREITIDSILNEKES